MKNKKNLINKTCRICCILKEIECFEKRKTTKDGYRSECRSCRAELKSKYYQNNKERIREKEKKYYFENKEKIKTRNKNYALNNKENIKRYNKEYRIKNLDKLKSNNKKYYENNKEILKENSRNYKLKHREKYKQYNAANWRKYSKNKEVLKKWYLKNKDEINRKRRSKVKSLNSKISDLLRSRIRWALKSQNAHKCLSSAELLGCSVEFYKEYIESKFTKGMTWENYCADGWHIDHIRPCASFDLTNPEQQKQCFHYTNTQPLWATTKIAISYGESVEYIGNLEKSHKLSTFGEWEIGKD